MQYLTIALELLQARPALYAQVSGRDDWRSELHRLAVELKSLHLNVLEQLKQSQPQTSELLLKSQAAEIAIEQFQELLDAQEQTLIEHKIT